MNDLEKRLYGLYFFAENLSNMGLILEVDFTPEEQEYLKQIPESEREVFLSGLWSPARNAEDWRIILKQQTRYCIQSISMEKLEEFAKDLKLAIGAFEELTDYNTPTIPCHACITYGDSEPQRMTLETKVDDMLDLEAKLIFVCPRCGGEKEYKE